MSYVVLIVQHVFTNNTCTHGNVDEESNDTCLNRHALKIRRCNLSDDDGNTKEYHSGWLGNYCCMYVCVYVCMYVSIYVCTRAVKLDRLTDRLFLKSQLLFLVAR